MDMPVRPPGPPIEAYPLRFTGDGGVYLGVWGVNLLLTMVTLGLFTPFARRRTLKYFYAHTLLAGHPLEFTGGLKRMFLGFLLVVGLYLAYNIASGSGQAVAAGLLGLGGVLLAPFLWASAQRFRLGSTRWRGIRGRFTATWAEVYGASWPLLALFGAGAIAGVVAVLGRGARPGPLPVIAGALAFLAAVVLCMLRLTYNYARLRVIRSDFGGEAGHWKVEFGDWLRIGLGAFGLFVAIAVVLLAAIVVAAGGSAWLLVDATRRPGAMAGLMLVLTVVASFLVVLLAAGPARAWAEARLHALVWNSVGLGRVARFRCDLRPWPYVRLRIRNMLLTAISMGFWRPFALTSEYRMKLESVTLHVKGGLDQLVGQRVQEQGAFGDAVADAVGFDLVA
jgi:uncharacterized membrane protein YjgN (DUF898 family)